MDWATLGALLVGVGTVASAAVAFLGKRGENAVTGYSSLTDDLQEERAGLKEELAAKKQELLSASTALAQEAAARAHAEAEITRLRRIVTDLGGDPS